MPADSTPAEHGTFAGRYGTFAERYGEFCGRCGEPGVHPTCVAALSLEPPRYCGSCRRRMVVQVTPTGWTATCSSHGVLRNGREPAES